MFMAAAAKILKARESELKGTVVLLFQPAEEGGAGGKFMVEEGALEGVLGVHGIHVMPIYPSGIITSIVSTEHSLRKKLDTRLDISSTSDPWWSWDVRKP